MNKKLSIRTALLTALVLPAWGLAAPTTYTLTPIDGGPAAAAILPLALNDQGLVVGEAALLDSPAESFRFQHGVFESLDLGIWVDVNEQGQIVGRNRQGQAVIWQDGDQTVLDDLPEELPASFAFAINNLGQVAGDGLVEASPPDVFPNPGYRVPVAWLEGTAVTRLELPEDAQGSGGAEAINDLQQVIGYAPVMRAAEGQRNIQRGLLWQDGELQILDNLHPDGGSRPEAINNQGLIVGASDYQSIDGSWRLKASVWQHGAIEAIVPLKTVFSSRASGVNDHGQVVGGVWGRDEQGALVEYAFLWSPESGLQNLNDLVDSAELDAYGAAIVHASDINSHGQIVVTAVTADRLLGFVLTPRADDEGGDGQPGADSDNDGVPDAQDECPGTEAGATVNASGCSLAQLVPCDGPVAGGSWRSQLHYRADLREAATEFRRDGLISQRDLVGLMRDARKSSCGRWSLAR